MIALRKTSCSTVSAAQASSMVPPYPYVVSFARDTADRRLGKLLSFLSDSNLRNLNAVFLHLSKEIDKHILFYVSSFSLPLTKPPLKGERETEREKYIYTIG